MNDIDNRLIARDSLFILAELRLDGQDAEHRVKVRNLSAGGMMGDGDVKVTRGTAIWVNLRNVGWIDGTVAWVQDNRFGVAFAQEIHPKVVRGQVTTPTLPEAMILSRRSPAKPPEGGQRRKII